MSFDPLIRPCRQGDLAALDAAAKADNHIVVAPTHLVLKDNQIAGYVSLGAIPMVLVWMDTKQAKVRDSICLLNFIENMAVNGGAKHLSLPCVTSSPFRPFMERVGFVSCGQHDLLIKPL